MSELKSAFDIDGFLSGKCEIKKEYSNLPPTYFRRKGGIFEYKASCVSTWKYSDDKINYFNEKIFSPVIEKPKMYIYKYRYTDYDTKPEYKIYVHKEVETFLTWEEFVDAYASFKSNFKLIKTIEVNNE